MLTAVIIREVTNIQENCHLHTRNRENLTSHGFRLILIINMNCFHEHLFVLKWVQYALFEVGTNF
jgi:hypothetical protein